MTIKEIAQRLREQGHQVTLYQRKDRGYLITSIDGVKYRGAEGNNRARVLVGTELATRRKSQLKSITPMKGSSSAKARKKGKPRKPPLSDELLKEIRKTQRLWRQTQAQGRVTTAKIRYVINNEGEEAAMITLKKLQAYSKGIAYDDNIEHLAERIERLATGHSKNASELRNLANKIRRFKGQNRFKDEWISRINEYFYNAELQASGGDDRALIVAVNQTLQLINN